MDASTNDSDGGHGPIYRLAREPAGGQQINKSDGSRMHSLAQIWVPDSERQSTTSVYLTRKAVLSAGGVEHTDTNNGIFGRVATWNESWRKIGTW